MIRNHRGMVLISTCFRTGRILPIEFKVQIMFMPPTLKKLMGHIAFGAWVRGWVTLFVPTVTFKPFKLDS